MWLPGVSGISLQLFSSNSIPSTEKARNILALAALGDVFGEHRRGVKESGESHGKEEEDGLHDDVQSGSNKCQANMIGQTASEVMNVVTMRWKDENEMAVFYAHLTIQRLR